MIDTLRDLNLPMLLAIYRAGVGGTFGESLRRKLLFEIRGVQTDNGSEFLGEFAKELKKEGNGYVERFNRTLEEEFIEYRGLMRYLIWYNTERAHSGLENVSPLE
ncbi:MAG: integrase core domain-containing protein [Caldimicrobium sp.]|nr:integrase core domain-containing protein [Caldimicrobium sp.]